MAGTESIGRSYGSRSRLWGQRLHSQSGRSDLMVAEAASRPPAELRQEALRRNEKRVALQHATNDHRWVGAQDVHDGVAAKLVETVGADDDVVVIAPQVVHARLELDHLVDERAAGRGPSIRHTMRLWPKPWRAFPLASCSKKASIRSGSKR